jgi:hypothetical protein
MKLNFFFSAVLILVQASIALSQTPTNGLVAFYKFNLDRSKEPATVYDFTRNQNNGTIVNGVSYTSDRFGVGCSAMLFDGTGYITVPSSNSLKRPRNAFTAAVWFKFTKGADFFKEWITICCKSDQTDETEDSPQYRMQATAQTVSINSKFTENFVPQLSYEVWYFYAYTFDGSQVRVFLNGKFVYEHNYNGQLTANDMPLEIGRDLPGGLEYFDGTMDDLRIYDRALDESELIQIYKDMSEARDPDRCAQNVAVTPPPKKKPSVDPVTTPDPDPVTDPDPTPVTTTSSSSSSSKKRPPRDTVVVKDTVFVKVTQPAPKPATVIVKDTVFVKVPQQAPPPTMVIVKDTVFVNVPAKKDPAPLDSDAYKDLPVKIGNIPIEYQKKVVVKSSEVKIYPYDHDKEDGDIVSINVNGAWVRDKYELKSKNPNPSEFTYIRCSLNPGGNNYFVSRAWNEGTMKPNTLTIEIDDGVSVQKVHINSKVGLSGGIRIICDQ